MEQHTQTNEHSEHPLKRSWTWWEHRAKSIHDKSWIDQFLGVADFFTVEMFWAIWKHYPKPSILFAGTYPGDPPNYIQRGDRTSRVLGILCFRTPVPPESRAKRSDGSRWTGERSVVNVNVQHGELDKIDKLWENFCLLTIGEPVVPGDVMSGVWIANRTSRSSSSYNPKVVNVRFEIWWDASLCHDKVVSWTESFHKCADIHKIIVEDWTIKT